MGIPIDQMAAEVQKELDVYSESVATGTKKLVDKVAKEAADELKQTSPRRTTKYAKSWTTATSYENQRTKRNTVHNRSRYHLSHLLEDGHALKRGGRVIGSVSARVHIAPVEAKAERSLETGMKEVVKG